MRSILPPQARQQVGDVATMIVAVSYRSRAVDYGVADGVIALTQPAGQQPFDRCARRLVSAQLRGLRRMGTADGVEVDRFASFAAAQVFLKNVGAVGSWGLSHARLSARRHARRAVCGIVAWIGIVVMATGRVAGRAGDLPLGRKGFTAAEQACNRRRAGPDDPGARLAAQLFRAAKIVPASGPSPEA
ncbi:MAG: hypothetical protein H6836_05260 [Planctomycetes bacterium]|nr:hypothetical protein [Planctomycetota bacterium]MCB9888965.1 hypothetical protein [Planctomycetota bacterium]